MSDSKVESDDARKPQKPLSQNKTKKQSPTPRKRKISFSSDSEAESDTPYKNLDIHNDIDIFDDDTEEPPKTSALTTLVKNIHKRKATKRKIYHESKARAVPKGDYISLDPQQHPKARPQPVKPAKLRGQKRGEKLKSRTENPAHSATAI